MCKIENAIIVLDTNIFVKFAKNNEIYSNFKKEFLEGGNNVLGVTDYSLIEILSARNSYLELDEFIEFLKKVKKRLVKESETEKYKKLLIFNFLYDKKYIIKNKKVFLTKKIEIETSNLVELIARTKEILMRYFMETKNYETGILERYFYTLNETKKEPEYEKVISEIKNKLLIGYEIGKIDETIDEIFNTEIQERIESRIKIKDKYKRKEKILNSIDKQVLRRIFDDVVREKKILKKESYDLIYIEKAYNIIENYLFKGSKIKNIKNDFIDREILVSLAEENIYLCLQDKKFIRSIEEMGFTKIINRKEYTLFKNKY